MLTLWSLIKDKWRQNVFWSAVPQLASKRFSIPIISSLLIRSCISPGFMSGSLQYIPSLKGSCFVTALSFFYYKNRPKISLLTNIKQNAWKVICRRVWFWTILWNFTLKCSLNNVMYAQNEPVTYSWRDHETWRYVSHGSNDGWYFNLWKQKERFLLSI